MSRSPKLNFLDAREEDADQDLFESLIQVEPNEYKPNTTSNRVHRSLARTRILRGGLGSGKTRTATQHIDALALAYPGSLHFIGRKDITALKVTTQREFLDKVVRRETIQTFNVNENNLYYKNGSLILFRETKDPDKVKSMELASYMLDEADENETDEIWEKLDDRLRQKIKTPNGVVIPPYCGMLVFNPTHEQHWLYHLSKRTDIDVEDFQFNTYDNRENLPPDYIHNLERKLAPWERNRLILGNWGREIKGKPVYHGFTEETHVRPLKVREDLPLLRSWDFGYGHPAVSWAQIDAKVGRVYLLREFLGENQKIHEVAAHVLKATRDLCGPNYPVMDYGDPHGADEKDTSVSSIEYLRVHHQIFVQHRRERIKTGMEEIQDKILSEARTYPDEPENEAREPLLVVDPQCKISIDCLLGGYHRDEQGLPKKDGYFDHLPDTWRYLIVHNMNRCLAQKRAKRRYLPTNFYTGYGRKKYG